MTPVDIDKLKELLSKGVIPSDSGWYVSGYTSCGTARISDGLAHGMFPFHCEAPQAELIVAAVNSLPALIAKAERVDALERALALYTDDASCGTCECLVSSGEAARNALSPKPEDAAS